MATTLTQVSRLVRETKIIGIKHLLVTIGIHSIFDGLDGAAGRIRNRYAAWVKSWGREPAVRSTNGSKSAINTTKWVRVLTSRLWSVIIADTEGGAGLVVTVRWYLFAIRDGAVQIEMRVV